ncbi:MAG: hypothetical protein JW384_03307 [Nitrosomonadaceae bacterium]|nr:hypothetical protein [Nitrosomonadaceae bacterium]
MSKQIAVLVANPAFSAKTLIDYLAYARANPGKVNYGTSGEGSISHLGGSWLHSLTNTRVTFVAHKGAAPMVIALLGGHVDVGIASLIAALPLIKAGKVQPLSVMGDQRSSQLPTLLTAAEQGVPGYNYPSWIGFLSAGGTPLSIVNQLSDALVKVVRSPEIVLALDQQGSIPIGSTPQQFRSLLVTEQARWQKLVEETGMKLME